MEKNVIGVSLSPQVTCSRSRLLARTLMHRPALGAKFSSEWTHSHGYWN